MTPEDAYDLFIEPGNREWVARHIRTHDDPATFALGMVVASENRGLMPGNAAVFAGNLAAALNHTGRTT